MSHESYETHMSFLEPPNVSAPILLTSAFWAIVVCHDRDPNRWSAQRL